MTTINADMSDSQLWIPLSEADALAAAEGWYTVESENLELSSFHMTHASRQPSATNRPNGRTVIRGVGGSTPASHSSGATLSRYYPESPSGIANPLTGNLLTGGFAIKGSDDAPTTGASVTVANGDHTGLDVGGSVTFAAGENTDWGTGGNLQAFGGGDDSGGGGDIDMRGGIGLAGKTGGAAYLAGGDGDNHNTSGIAINAQGGQVGANGNLIVTGLPTDDPGVSDALFTPAAAVLISGGTVPVVPLTTPSVQDVIDALVALGLVSQSD